MIFLTRAFNTVNTDIFSYAKIGKKLHKRASYATMTKHPIICDDLIMIDNDHGRRLTRVDVFVDLKRLYIHKKFVEISTKTEATDCEVDGMLYVRRETTTNTTTTQQRYTLALSQWSV